MSNSTTPNFIVQTASLWASGDSSVFSGSGGPWGYDPFFGQFAGVVNSAGLDAAPFADQLWNVEAGDEVVFVVAVQNKGSVTAFDLLLRDAMPAGFGVPPEGTGLSVTDGAGNPLDVAGDLFDPSGGLQILNPVAANDPFSGADIILVTFALQATAALAIPVASVRNSAQVVSYAAVSGGPDLSGQAASGTLAAATQVTTSDITVTSAPDQTLVTLPSGRQASFDITVSIPAGEVRDLRIDEIFPHSGNAWLRFVSAQVLQRGADLTFSNPATVQADGSISFGTVDNAASGQATNSESIVVRVTVEGAGTAAGQGVLDTKVSAADPNVAGGRWTDDVTNTLPLEAPDVPPTIGGTSGGQNATNTMQVRPFAAITLADPDPGQTGTLRIHLSDPLFGTLSGVADLARSGTDYVLSGSIDQVQADARRLLFATGPGRTGTENFTLTLDDGAGGTATDSATTVTVAASAAAAAAIQHFPLSPTGTVLTSTAAGSRTVAEVETYQGPVDYLQSQFIYDGTAALAIVAQSPNMFIKNVAGSTAVQLLSGQNVVDAGSGSNFLLGGTGTDVFFLDGRQLEPTWDTIVGFHAGDIATLWGFKDGVSQYHWDNSAGVAGYTGLTLRADLTGNGNVDASLTFAGTTSADLPHFTVTKGTVGGNDYMAIFAV